MKFMKLSTSLFLSGFISLAQAADVAYKFTLVDIPIVFQGRPDTLRLLDRNNRGEMVGVHYFDASYYVSSDRKTVTRLDCGGDSSTTVSAINNPGQIVGTCNDSTGAKGFVYNRRNGNYTLLSYPGSIYTAAYGINDLGHVVGTYASDQEGRHSFHAFILKDGVYSTVDAPDPEQMAGALVSINKQGQAIGDYEHHVFSEVDTNSYDTVIPFLYDNGSFSILGFPGAANPSPCCQGDTFVYDINNLSQIVGTSFDSTGKPVWFLFDDDRYFTITGFPTENVVSNAFFGLNDKGEIAGHYFERIPCATCGPHGEPWFTFALHSFVAVPAPVKAPRR
jgi:probable HAF family extracellular repeat protein